MLGQQVTAHLFSWLNNPGAVGILGWLKGLSCMDSLSPWKLNLGEKSPKGLLEFSKHFPQAIPLGISMENYSAYAKNPIIFLK
jgi:hypothetical protein